MSDASTGLAPRLVLLGGIDLVDAPPGAAGTLLAQPKLVAFLAYLALAPAGRFQRRDRVVALLWPELDQGHARAALRKSVHAARAALGGDVLSSRGDEEILLPPNALRCDVTEFSAAADEGKLARALDLYRGELMPGFHVAGCAEFDAWLDDQRQTSRGRAAAAAWALAVRMENDQQFTLAGSWARRAVRYTGEDERVLRRAMQMLDRFGDRAGALRLCDDFAQRLRQSLDGDLSPDTVALRATFKNG